METTIKRNVIEITTNEAYFKFKISKGGKFCRYIVNNAKGELWCKGYDDTFYNIKDLIKEVFEEVSVKYCDSHIVSIA
jgi:hypothetical protein